ncbi:unnamed protein product [Didymodactylos carnosus]|uniref:Uncharacterized protein n=1 Tax=Didymodactylos carnosus TaxID=1234261 RepID=A0A814PRS1_9BILA|nr:unnamed protein product [Didymodactylos carnosus]CAF3874069.1 unnamed protein product [Didymodactylos carnosus]
MTLFSLMKQSKTTDDILVGIVFDGYTWLCVTYKEEGLIVYESKTCIYTNRLLHCRLCQLLERTSIEFINVRIIKTPTTVLSSYENENLFVCFAYACCEGVKQWETVNELTTSAINNIDNRILLEFTENLNDSDNVFDDIQYIDSPEKAQDDGEDNGYDNVGICQGEIDIEKYIELIEPIYNPPSDNSINDSQNIRSTILQPLSAGLHKLIIIILFDGQHWLTLVNYKSARHFTVFDRHFTGFSRRLICMLSRAVNFTCYTYYRVELLPVKQCPIDKKTDIYFVLVYAVLVIKLYADKNKNKTDIANIKFNIQQLTDYFDNSFNKLIIDRLLFDVVSDTVNVPLCKRYCTFTQYPWTFKITLSCDRTLKLNFSGNCKHSTSEIQARYIREIERKNLRTQCELGISAGGLYLEQLKKLTEKQKAAGNRTSYGTTAAIIQKISSEVNVVLCDDPNEKESLEKMYREQKLIFNQELRSLLDVGESLIQQQAGMIWSAQLSTVVWAIS